MLKARLITSKKNFRRTAETVYRNTHKRLHIRDLAWLYGVLIGATILLLLVTPFFRAQYLISHEPKSIQIQRDLLLSIASQLGALPAPSAISIQDYAVANDNSKEWDSFKNKLPENPDMLAYPSKIPVLLPYILPPGQNKINRANDILSKQGAKTLYEESANVQSRTKQLAEHHSRTIGALAPLLGYQPKADFETMDPKLPGTYIDRIARAEKGLDTAISSLNSIRGTYEDTELVSCIQLIQQLRLSLDQFRNDKNKDNWASSVRKSQGSIIANRQSFLTEARDDLNKEINRINAGLADIESKWKSAQ